VNGQLALNTFCGAALLLTSQSRLRAKELVFTGELLDARTGEPHPDVGTLRIASDTPTAPGTAVNLVVNE
jgi:hypothetical protein